MSGSASWMRRRTSARVSARQPPRDRIRSSMRREAAFSFARFASAPGLAFAPAFGGDLDLAADLRGLLARDVPLALGFAFFSVILRPFFLGVSQVAFFPPPTSKVLPTPSLHQPPTADHHASAPHF